MRRLIALFLLCLFSLQSAWAVAAGYCGHEDSRAAATTHFGHHDHDHDAAPAAPDAADTGTLQADPDCHACHACGVGLMPSVSTAAITAAGGHARPGHERHAPPPAPETPERPDWLRRA